MVQNGNNGLAGLPNATRRLRVGGPERSHTLSKKCHKEPVAQSFTDEASPQAALEFAAATTPSKCTDDETVRKQTIRKRKEGRLEPKLRQGLTK